MLRSGQRASSPWLTSSSTTGRKGRMSGGSRGAGLGLELGLGHVRRITHAQTHPISALCNAHCSCTDSSSRRTVQCTSLMHRLMQSALCPSEHTVLGTTDQLPSQATIQLHHSFKLIIKFKAQQKHEGGCEAKTLTALISWCMSLVMQVC